MQISEQQLIKIGQQKIRNAHPKFVEFFSEKIKEEVLIYEDEDKTLEVFVRLQIEEALKLNFLNEEGVAKFIFLLLLVDNSFQKSNEFSKLKNNILATKNQSKKNKLLDIEIYDITDFENYWKN